MKSVQEVPSVIGHYNSTSLYKRVRRHFLDYGFLTTFTGSLSHSSDYNSSISLGFTRLRSLSKFGKLDVSRATTVF